MKGKRKVDGRLEAARNMPPCRHSKAGQPFDIFQSDALNWLLAQREIRAYLWDRIAQSGYIRFDHETHMWEGVDD